MATRRAKRIEPKSEALNDQRRAAGSLPRAGGRKAKPSEERDRVLAVAIGRRLCLRVMRTIQRRFDQSDEVEKLMRAALRAKDFEAFKNLSESATRLTNYDLNGFANNLHDRFGQPKRTSVDVDVQGMTQAVLVVPDALWAEAEKRGEDAPSAAPARDAHGAH